MTDKDIIKSLRKHTTDLCSNCKVEKTTLCNECICEIERNALDLINRQQAEIERLTINMNAFGLGVKREKERADQIKSKAIKELAKKTNEMITEIYNKHIFGNNDLEAEEKDAIINFSDDVVIGFDNLVKETVGEQG